MPIHPTPPPGFTTEPWETLEMSRANFYATKLNTLWSDGPLSAYQTRPNTSIFYADVGKVRYWLKVRQGLIALGAMNEKSPLLPSFDLEYWFDDDPNGTTCPKCGGDAVCEGWDEPPVWCPACGVVE